MANDEFKVNDADHHNAYDYCTEFRNGNEQCDQTQKMHLVRSAFAFQAVVIQQLKGQKR